MAPNARIGVGLTSRTAASEDLWLEVAFTCLEDADCGAVADRDILIFENVLHSIHRFPFYAVVPGAVGIRYTGMIDPRQC